MQANAERVGYTKLNSSSNNLYTHPFTFTRSTRKVDVNKYFILATLLYQNNTNDLRQELHMLAFVGLEAICSPFVVRLVASNASQLQSVSARLAIVTMSTVQVMNP